jgi:putative hydrolase of the HAD superfamily
VLKLCRLRFHGALHTWGLAIYLASRDGYEDNFLPSGRPSGSPEEALDTELIEYARRLRPRYRTGILSNSFVGAREREQEAYGFEDLVDEIVYSHEAGMSKPDPRIYALVCARLDVRPQETVFLDDADQCVVGARDAGLHAIHYQDNAQAIEEIEKLLTTP